MTVHKQLNSEFIYIFPWDNQCTMQKAPTSPTFPGQIQPRAGLEPCTPRADPGIPPGPQPAERMVVVGGGNAPASGAPEVRVEAPAVNSHLIGSPTAKPRLSSPTIGLLVCLLE